MNKHTCKNPLCHTQPTYGVKKGQATHCIQHKSDDMYNVIHTCAAEDCTKQPSYGLEKNKAIFCNQHKYATMYNVLHVCSVDNCYIQPSFGLVKGKSTHCDEHKSEYMYDVRSTLCFKCSKRATYGYESKLVSCFNHKSDEMKNIIYTKTPKYNTNKETRIKNLLDKNNFVFTHNKQIQNDMGYKYRPDFLFDCETHFVILEVDEFAHESYNKHKELSRMIHISSILSKPTKFIRYNPDNRLYSAKHKKKSLLACITKELEHVSNTDTQYLFY